MKVKHVLVTTEHRGVFYGELEDYNSDSRVATLVNAKMAIYWGTTKGVLELAATGPTPKSRISLPAPRLVLEKCTMVSDVSPEAVEQWAKS